MRGLGPLAFDLYTKSQLLLATQKNFDMGWQLARVVEKCCQKNLLRKAEKKVWNDVTGMKKVKKVLGCCTRGSRSTFGDDKPTSASPKPSKVNYHFMT